MGAVIQSQLDHLRVLAAGLNGVWGEGLAPADRADLIRRAASIAEAMIEADARGESAPPATQRPRGAAGLLPHRVVQRFAELAQGVTFRYDAIMAANAGTFFLTSDQPASEPLEMLVWFLGSPVRHRLRRCPQCGKWFVDATRDGHQRRCSLPCTIKWRNQQRAVLRRQVAPKKEGAR